jgi:UrcA family protein
MKSFICFAGAAVMTATLAVSGPALAGPIIIPSPENPEVLQTTVKLGDLNLSREAGADVAVQRIRRAARAVCGDDMANFVYPLALTNGRRACAKKSTYEAVDRLDHPMVTRAAYGAKAPAEFAAR